MQPEMPSSRLSTVLLPARVNTVSCVGRGERAADGRDTARAAGTRLRALLVAHGVEGERLARAGEVAGRGGLHALCVALEAEAEVSARSERLAARREGRTFCSSRSLGGRTRTSTAMRPAVLSLILSGSPRGGGGRDGAPNG